MDGALDEGVEDLVGQVREGVLARGRGVGGPEGGGEPERAAASDGGRGPAGGGVDAPVRGGGHQGDVVDAGLAVAVLWGLAAGLGTIAEPPEVLVAVARAVERADARVRERDPRGRDLEVDLRAGVDLHAPEGVGTPALALGHQADVVDAGPGEGVRGLRAIGGGGTVDLPSVALGVARGVEELDAQGRAPGVAVGGEPRRGRRGGHHRDAGRGGGAVGVLHGEAHREGEPGRGVAPPRVGVGPRVLVARGLAVAEVPAVAP